MSQAFGNDPLLSSNQKYTPQREHIALPLQKCFQSIQPKYYLPRYKTTDIDLIGHQSYHKGLFVSKVCHAYEIEKAHHNNQLVYPVYTWVKCTKFKLSVSIPSHINGFSCDKLLEPLSHQTLMRSKIANISRCTTGEHAIFN